MEESDTYTYNYQVSSGFYQGEEEADMQSAAEGDYALKIYCDYLLYKMALPPTRSLEEKKAQAEDDGIGLILSIPVQALDKDSPLWNVSTDTEIVQNEGLRFYRFPISEEGTYAITAGETGTAEGYVEFGTGDEWSYGGRVSSEDASGISLRKGDVLYVSMKMYGEEGKGTEQGSFRLERVGDLERKSFAVSEPEDVMYSEGWQFPSVTVTDQESGKKLKEGKDYTLFASLDTSVRDEDSIGTIRITVTGKANYVERRRSPAGC